MIDYFLDADDAYLRGMAVDRSRLPSREQWLRDVVLDQNRPDDCKQRLYVGWFYDGRLVGHSSVNQIEVGEEAFIHLHLWDASLRKSGAGTEFFRKSVDYFRERLRLKRVICEPYAHNCAPNRVLEKLGFTLVGRMRKIPGPINFEQDVNRWELRFYP